MDAINYVAGRWTNFSRRFQDFSERYSSHRMTDTSFDRVFSKVTTDSSKFARIENPNERLLKERPLGIKNQQANSLLE